jgi:hypothetical protein
VAIYNPDLLSKQELVAQFIARRPLLQRLVQDVGRPGTTQHHLIVGQRGMGKTTLLRRLRYAIEDDPALSAAWLPLTFPEEQYNVARLSDFYLNLVDALGDALERLGRTGEARALDEARERLPDRDERERARQALELLCQGADRVGRRLLLLVDNIDLVFDRLKGDHWAIREVLSSERRLLLIGASAAMLEATYTYKEAFYDFFQIHELSGLSEEETREVLLHLARAGNTPEVARVVEEEPGRIKTFHVLAGGNPRTVVLLYDVLSKGVGSDVRADLERLLDRVTPLYKARFEAMPAQSQQIMDALAIHWHPISAAELAVLARLEVNTVSSQLNRLEKQGLVEKVAYHPANKAGFQVAERFFNIWYLMRASRRVRQRLIWLVEFLRMLYRQGEIRGHAERYLRERDGGDQESRMRRAEYGLALAQVVEEAPLRGALESVSVHALAVDRKLREQLGGIIDLEGADAELDPTNYTFWNGLAWARYTNDKVDASTEAAARRAVALKGDNVHALHTLATVLTARDNWSEAEPFARRYLAEGSPEFHERTWSDTLLFFREAARTGHAADAVRLLDDLSLADRFRPLREALAAIAAGSRLPLLRIAPEIRHPAEEILDQLWPQGLE